MRSPLFLGALGGTVSYQLHQDLTGYHKTKEFSTASNSLAMCYTDREWMVGSSDIGPVWPPIRLGTTSLRAYGKLHLISVLKTRRASPMQMAVSASRTLASEGSSIVVIRTSGVP